MDPTLGPSAEESGRGLDEDGGVIAPAFAPAPDVGDELDLSDELAWDEFLPDEDESEDDPDHELAFGELAAEDAALAAEDLDLRWDAFAADDDAEDDEESARVEAVLDRMERRAQNYGERDDATDGVRLDIEPALDDAAPPLEVALVEEAALDHGVELGEVTSLDETPLDEMTGPVEVAPVDELALDEADDEADDEVDDDAARGGLANATVGGLIASDAVDGEDRGDEEYRGHDGEAGHIPFGTATAAVAATHIEVKPEEPAEIHAWDDDDHDREVDEEEEIDLVAIRAAWDEFRSKWDDAASDGDSEVVPAPSAASREDDVSWESWVDDEAYHDELVEAGSAAGGAQELTDGPHDWADHEEWNDAVFPVHSEFADTTEVTDTAGTVVAQDDTADDWRGEDARVEVEAVEYDTIDAFVPDPVADSAEPVASTASVAATIEPVEWAFEPVDEARALAMATWFDQTDEPGGNEHATADDRDDADDGDNGDEESEGRRPHTLKRTARRSNETRRRVLLAALFVAVVICAVVVVHAGRARSEPHPPASTTSPVVSSAGQLSRLESAISDVQSASSGAQAGLMSLGVFPTPPRVAVVVNPYVDSLELYQNVVAAGVAVPTTARSAFASANALVAQDVTFLKSINGLPPVQLGSFINQFFSRTTQLQATLDHLQQDLQPVAP